MCESSICVTVTQKCDFSFVPLKLYPSLCELAHVLSVDGPVRQRLDSLAGELAKAADKELQVDVTASFSHDPSQMAELLITGIHCR